MLPRDPRGSEQRSWRMELTHSLRAFSRVTSRRISGYSTSNKLDLSHGYPVAISSLGTPRRHFCHVERESCAHYAFSVFRSSMETHLPRRLFTAHALSTHNPAQCSGIKSSRGSYSSPIRKRAFSTHNPAQCSGIKSSRGTNLTPIRKHLWNYEEEREKFTLTQPEYYNFCVEQVWPIRCAHTTNISRILIVQYNGSLRIWRD